MSTFASLALASLVASATMAPAAAGPTATQQVTGDAVVAWNANAGEASVAACFIGGYAPQEARMYAMMHVAIHDALNGIDRRSQPYAVDLLAAPGTSPEAAVAAAARDVLVSVLGSFAFFLPPECIAAGVANVEADYAAALGAIADGTAKTQGIALGQDAAEAILTLRASDGYDTPTVDPNYQEGTAPGEYRYTPGTPFAFAPFLGEDLAPFALTDSTQFRPGPPYRLKNPKYAADVNEVQRLGGDDVTTPSARTDDQTEIALFWVESSPLMWNRIARTVSTAEGLDLWENARLFGLLNIALTDGYIGTFETKYHYRFWRPVTAIRLADIDDNPATIADPTWTPLLENPPIPDYDSGHAVEGGAGAEVLRLFFQTDRMSFSLCSFTLPEGQTVHRRDADPASLHQLLPGDERERGVPDLCGLPFPGRGRDGEPPRQEDRPLDRAARLASRGVAAGDRGLRHHRAPSVCHGILDAGGTWGWIL